MIQKYSIFLPEQITEINGLSNYLLSTHRFPIISVLFVVSLWFLGCSSLKKSIRELDHNPVFKDSFTGFVLYDPENKQVLFDHHGSKYFTPASNTKLYTFYVANRILGDSIPAFVYRTEADSVWLWGTGDPSFLNPDLPESTVGQFLKEKFIYLVSSKMEEPIFGPGWAWDDYSGSYQREKNSFPIYGNAVHISWDSLSNQSVIRPKYFRDSVMFQATETERAMDRNLFYVDQQWDRSDTLAFPLKTSPAVIAKLWSDTLASTVQWVDFMPPDHTAIKYSISADSAYKQMLQISDNFVAEQLILLCSWKLFGELNSAKLIELASDSLLGDLPQPPIWIDGSGLSRYNLFTPHSTVKLLEKIYQEVSEERILDLFPAGGQSGTIENYYKSDTPYIYAKTGTLRNNHTLSGYLIAKSGKKLIFSFMHNHYAGGSVPIKMEMEKLLWQIHLKY